MLTLGGKQPGEAGLNHSYGHKTIGFLKQGGVDDVRYKWRLTTGFRHTSAVSLVYRYM